MHNIRNFGIIAHVDAGKTTTTEKILYYTGTIYYSGNVDDGTTHTDWMLEEKEHGITIKSSAVQCLFEDTILNIIDTPGHIDFSSEVNRSLRVLDSTVTIICASSGIQTQTINTSTKADNYELPGIFYINKLDKFTGAIESVTKQIENTLKKRTVLITIPYYSGGIFNGVINIIDGSFTSADNKKTSTYPEEYKEIIEIYKEQLIDVLSLYDSSFTELVINEKVTPENIYLALKKQTILRNVSPVLCGSSATGCGVYELLTAIKLLLPNPNQTTKKIGFNKTESELDTVIYIFKTLIMPGKEKPLYYVRIYTGSINNVSELTDPQTKKKYNITALFSPDIHQMTKIDLAKEGDIVLLELDEQAYSGMTLSNSNKCMPLEKINYPEPVFYVRAETDTTEEKETLISIKDHYLMDDPSVIIKFDNQTGETLVGGVGELQLSILQETLHNNYKINVHFAKPQIAYRVMPKNIFKGTLETTVLYSGKLNKINIEIEIDPLVLTKNNNKFHSIKEYSFLENELKNNLIYTEIASYPFINTSIKIINIISDNIPKEVLIAGVNKLINEQLKSMEIVKLEPLMKVVIKSNNIHTGTITRDIQSRKGTVVEIIHGELHTTVTGNVPMKNLFGYSTDLRSLTHGDVDFTIMFNYYIPSI